jgi:plastocyanin
VKPVSILLVAVLLLGSAARAPAADVVIKGFGFTPKSLVIEVGTRVRWDNRDEIEHTVTALADSGATPVFNGVMSGQGKAFSFTFDHAGSFAYQCARHTFMRGEIRVTPKGDR